MAIQPIDLQSLFSQIDKVGKSQAALKEGLQIQESIQQMHLQQKIEQDVQSVNQSPNMGEEANKIKDEKKRNLNQEEGKGKQGTDEEPSPDDLKKDMIKDPALGRNIDISG